MAKIKLTNDVLIDSNSVCIGIDVGNLLASNINNYVNNQQDCWVYVQTTSNSYNGERSIKIDDVEVAEHYNRYSSQVSSKVMIPVFLKKGQTIRTSDSSSNHILKVFGCK